MSAMETSHEVAKQNAAAAQGESKLFPYLIGLTVLGIIGVALYQFFGCATCY